MELSPQLRRMAEGQQLVLARADCLALGVSRHAVDHAIATGRWQRVYPGVIALTTGELTFLQRVWAAVLACGPDAVAAEGTALCLEDPGRPHRGPIIIAVPTWRQVRAPAGVVVRRRTSSLVVRARGGVPPHTIPSTAVLDITAGLKDSVEVVALVCEAARRRWLVPGELVARLSERSRHRWRALILAMVTEVIEGVESVLEHGDRRNDRRHGIPSGTRQVTLRVKGQRRRLDLRITLSGGQVLVKELDGRLGHEGGRFRDRLKDNSATLRGEMSLHFGFEDVWCDPCGVAAVQVHVLWQQGWTGQPKACGPTCSMFEELAQLARDYPLRGGAGRAAGAVAQRAARPARPARPETEDNGN